MNELDEKKFIEQAIKGDTLALSALLKQHYAFLLKYLIKITMNPAEAEDLTQETMIRCIEKIGTYNGRAKFSSWLITIATNLYIDDLRRKKRERKLWEQERGLRKMRWQSAHTDTDWPPVLDALGRLNHDVRVPVILKHYYGYSYDEISRMIGIAEGTVKSRVHNGLKRLRKELKTDETEKKRARGTGKL